MVNPHYIPRVFFSVMVTFAAPVVFALTAAPPPPQQDRPDQPDDRTAQVLKYEPKVLDFGEINRGERLTKEITITNISDQPVRFVRAFTSCGCTVTSLPRETIPPGASITVAVEFTGKNDGAQGSVVHLYLANRMGKVTINVKAQVRPPIVIQPEFFDPDTPKDLTLTVRSTDGSVFQIVSADPAVIDGIDEKRREKHTVTLSANKLKHLQNRVLSIRLYVKHPRTSWVLMRSTRFENSAVNKRLVAWARGNGAIDDLAEIIESGADLFETDSRGMTVLMYAAIAADPDRVRALMDFGADANAPRRDGWTALMGAAGSTQGNAETLRLFLDAGTDVNARDRFGRTALYWAARSGDADRIGLLLEAGARLNARGPFEETILISAAKGKRADNVKVLVEAGADVFAVDQRGRNALSYARQLALTSRGDAKTERAEMVRYLTEQMAKR